MTMALTAALTAFARELAVREAMRICEMHTIRQYDNSLLTGQQTTVQPCADNTADNTADNIIIGVVVNEISTYCSAHSSAHSSVHSSSHTNTRSRKSMHLRARYMLMRRSLLSKTQSCKTQSSKKPTVRGQIARNTGGRVVKRKTSSRRRAVA
jgi:hypothetical protein